MQLVLKYIWVLLMCVGLVGCGDSMQNPGAGGDVTPRHPGEDTYNKFCFSCHAAGVAGAPRTGDLDAWAPRAAKGDVLLLRSTIDGMPPGMPPMGLCAQCTEAQLAAAIDFMLRAE